MWHIKFLLFLLASYFTHKIIAQSSCVQTYQDLSISGNDLNGVPGTSAQCCQLCQYKTGCRAWTWNDFNGGTCWLKNDTQPLGRSNGTYSGIMSPPAGATYALNHTFDATNFWNSGTWHFALWDLTNITHNVDQATAERLGMIGYQNGKVYMGVDHNNTYPITGRPSLQINTDYYYNSGLFILSLDHMPVGPGTWPSWWFAGPHWPNSGEIDVLEGVDGMDYNQINLHTGPDCYMNNNNTDFFTGTWGIPTNKTYYECYQYGQSNTSIERSCSVAATNGTFQTAFNNAGGGVFALQWSPNEYIRVWNFVKPNVPADILNESPNPNPDTWGLPQAHFPLGSDCSTNHFANLTMLFDIALCGPWADAYIKGGEKACEEVVQMHPENFTETYWLINYAKVFCRPGEPCGWYNATCQFGC